MNDKLIQIILLILLCGYVLIKEIFAPGFKKFILKNGRNNSTAKARNPISIERFYQAFVDFKEVQEKWNEKREVEIKELDSRLDSLEKRR